MPTPAAIATAEWFYEIRHKSNAFPADVAENASAEEKYLVNLWAEEIDRRMTPTARTWERECEGRLCDRFDHEGRIATVTGHSDGLVWWRVEGTLTEPGKQMRSSTEGEFHDMVKRAMGRGAKFLPA
jgi:hypothetical protein